MNIYFASAYIYERPAKIAKALQLAGHSVFLFHLHDTNDAELKECFNYIFRASSSTEIDLLIERLGIKFIHIFSKDHDPLAMYLVSAKKCITIYDYKDIFEELIEIKYPETTYKNQEFLIMNSDYIIHRDFQIKPYLKIKKTITINSFYYPDLVWPNNNPYFLPYFEPIKLVLIGNFTIEKIAPQWAGLGYIKIFKSLLDQNFSIDVYPTCPDAYDKESFSEYIELSNSNKNFTIHNALPIKELNEELKKYHFGLVLTQAQHFENLNMYVKKILLRVGNATRCMDYIGAGLPIIFTQDLKQISIINKKYQIGIGLTGSDLFNLKEKINLHDYRNLRNSVIKISKLQLNSMYWVNKLISFYSEIIKK